MRLKFFVSWGSQLGACGFYGYRLKFWLFYGYRLFFFQLRLTKKFKINFFCFKEVNITKPVFFVSSKQITVSGYNEVILLKSFSAVSTLFNSLRFWFVSEQGDPCQPLQNISKRVNFVSGTCRMSSSSLKYGLFVAFLLVTYLVMFHCQLPYPSKLNACH